ncbi:hypothetical protein N7454_009247 [Penicillium verhagenii]|nr:hypothetical protein N7454_009247 [Penicillium verhagenii]
MCGIFFSLSPAPTLPTPETRVLLDYRGPDCCQTLTVHKEIPTPDGGIQSFHLTFISTVLALRGDHVYSQPLTDPATKSVLCWNGEAWKIAGERVSGNDTEHILNLFLRAVTVGGGDDDDDGNNAAYRLGEAAASISGPFAFVFYDATNLRLFFSRDCLGRRSLLQGYEEDGSLKICSVCDGSSSTHFQEVGFDGVYMIDLKTSHDTSATNGRYNIKTLPWSSDPSPPAGHIKTPIPPMNLEVPSQQPPALTLETPFVQELESKLRQSLELRINDVPEPPNYKQGQSAKVAVLFSGGLDCTLLARLSHDILALEETIDLLNVAFENPRVAAAAAASTNRQNLPASLSISTYEACPDRITGRSAYKELQQTCPGRKWRFIAIDIPYTETLAHRDLVKRLMRPHNTEMDLSIACALYFASRGQGIIDDSHSEQNPPISTDTSTIYTTTARVLLSGLGADELFAGYGRHGVAFNRNGFPGLVSEIHLDVSRLGQRNLGRDDRILSHWGRETRFPFLDEDFVAWVLRAPVWVKCGFGLASTADDQHTSGSIAGIDAEKMALRLVALRLGLRNVSREKKRAIQFGARTAKMEKGRTKGTDALV